MKGRVERGIVKVGEEVEIVGIKEKKKKKVKGVEMLRKMIEKGKDGEKIGEMIRGVGSEEVERGKVIWKKGYVKKKKKFKEEEYIMKKDEGGSNKKLLKK